MTHTIHHGDALTILPTLNNNTVDAIITDPPYGLEFMGKEWDKPTNLWEKRDKTQDLTGKTSSPYLAAHINYTAGPLYQQWTTAWATECLRVLKPGGHLIAFGGTRTAHRLTCGIEDAGYQIRDSIAWLYGTGFPKSRNISKDLDRTAGATRETTGTIKAPGYAETNVTEGAQTRNTYEFPLLSDQPITDEAEQWQGWGTALKPAHEPITVARAPLTEGTVAANIARWGTGGINIDANRLGDTPTSGGGKWPPNVALSTDQAKLLDTQTRPTRSRAGTRGKGWGIKAEPFIATAFMYVAKPDTNQRPDTQGVTHPTVKPLTLIRHLIRLFTPPGGVVLDPFLGSGTTAEACLLEGHHCIGIEAEATYLPLIEQRMNRHAT